MHDLHFRSSTESLLYMLRSSLSVSQSPILFSCVEAVFMKSIQVWEEKNKKGEQDGKNG